MRRIRPIHKLPLMKARFLLLGLLWLALGACQKDEDPALLPGAWQVLSIKPSGEGLQIAPRRYTLTFREDGGFSIPLDVNYCGGRYRSSAPGQIDLLELACTMICCDAPFAEEMAFILSTVERFDIRGRKLALRGERGEIALRSRLDE
jgi:heat shock protein HslJ